MQVSIRKATAGDCWEVTALDGAFADEEIATCEGMSLRQAEFHGDTIVGFPSAIWGATVQDRVSGSHATIVGLGLGRAFDCRIKKPAVYDGEDYVDAHTLRPLSSVRAVSVFMSGVFYKE